MLEHIDLRFFRSNRGTWPAMLPAPSAACPHERKLDMNAPDILPHRRCCGSCQSRSSSTPTSAPWQWTARYGGRAPPRRYLQPQSERQVGPHRLVLPSIPDPYAEYFRDSLLWGCVVLRCHARMPSSDGCHLGFCCTSTRELETEQSRIVSTPAAHCSPVPCSHRTAPAMRPSGSLIPYLAFCRSHMEAAIPGAPPARRQQGGAAAVPALRLRAAGQAAALHGPRAHPHGQACEAVTRAG